MSTVSTVPAANLQAYEAPASDTVVPTANSEAGADTQTPGETTVNNSPASPQWVALSDTGKSTSKTIKYEYKAGGSSVDVDLLYNSKTNLYTGTVGDLTITSTGPADKKQKIMFGVIEMVREPDNNYGTHFSGKISRAMDPSTSPDNKIKGQNIIVAFDYYPPTGNEGVKKEPILMENGGPGYSSTAKPFPFLDLASAARKTHGVIFIDSRGTGRSQPEKGTAICPELQGRQGYNPDDVNKCADQFKDTGYTYATRYVAKDIVALLKKGGVTNFHYYGVSYGTKLGQVVASEVATQNETEVGSGKPTLHIKSMTLDGAFSAVSSSNNPYAGTAAEVDPSDALKIFDRTYKAEINKGKQSGSLTDQLGRVLKKIDQNNADSKLKEKNSVVVGDSKIPVYITRGALYNVVVDGVGAGTVHKDLRAALQSYELGDSIPLARLIQETKRSSDITSENTPGPGSNNKPHTGASIVAGEGNKAINVLTNGYDSKPLFNLKSNFQDRATQVNTALAAAYTKRKASDYKLNRQTDPFTLSDMRGQVGEDRAHDKDHLSYPRGSEPLSPSEAIVRDVDRVFIISGDKDPITPKSGADELNTQIAGTNRKKPKNILVDGYHGAFLENGRDSAAAFYNIIDPKKGEELDSQPQNKIKPVVTVKQFAYSASQLQPARPLTGSAANIDQLKVITAVTSTISDVVSRADIKDYGNYISLYGGNATYKPDNDGNMIITLTNVKWTSDVSVFGTIKIDKDGIRTADVSFRSNFGNGSLKTKPGKSGTEISGNINNNKVSARTVEP